MNEKLLTRLKGRLLEEKARLEEELKEMEEGNLEQSQSEMTGENHYDDSFANTGTATFERERDFSLEKNLKDILDKVREALKRIEKGTYGICAHCGDEIDPARLKARPYAELCITCKRKEEGIW